MGWMDMLLGGLGGAATAGVDYETAKRKRQREDEELRLQRERQARMDALTQSQFDWTRSQGERANARQDRLDTEAAGEKALGRAVEISELTPPRPLSPTVAATLASAGMPLKGLSFSLPGLDGGLGLGAGPGTTVQANDPSRNIGMMRGWQTQAEKAKADLDKQVADRLAAIANDPTLPAPLRRMFEQQARGNQTSNTRVQDYMTPEEQQKSLEAETNQAIRLTNAQEAARTRGQLAVQGAKMSGAQPSPDVVMPGDPKTVELLDLSLAALKDISPTAAGYGSAVGFGVNQIPFASDEMMAGTAAGDFRTRFKNFEALQVLPKLSFMKGLGQMSNMEFDNMRNASAALKTTLSEPEYARQWAIMDENLRKARNRAMFGTNYINDPDGDGKMGTGQAQQPTFDVDLSQPRQTRPTGRQFMMRSGGGGQ